MRFRRDGTHLVLAGNNMRTLQPQASLSEKSTTGAARGANARRRWLTPLTGYDLVIGFPWMRP